MLPYYISPPPAGAGLVGSEGPVIPGLNRGSHESVPGLTPGHRELIMLFSDMSDAPLPGLINRCISCCQIALVLVVCGKGPKGDGLLLMGRPSFLNKAS